MAEIFWALKHIGYTNRDMKMRGVFTGTWLTRKDAIKFAAWNYGHPWKKLYQEGFRVVRAKVNASATGKFWALTNVGRFRPSGCFFTGTELTRKDTIEEAEKDYGRPWGKLYRDGYRAVRVNVTEIAG